MRYRLRTLLIVMTAIGAAFGWIALQYRIVTYRKAVALQLNERGDSVVRPGIAWGESEEREAEGDKSRRVSTFRRWLGDENVEAIFLHNADQDSREAIEAFPEANIYLVPRPIHDPRRAVPKTPG